jgi:hypothetical protein
MDFPWDFHGFSMSMASLLKESIGFRFVNDLHGGRSIGMLEAPKVMDWDYRKMVLQ